MIFAESFLLIFWFEYSEKSDKHIELNVFFGVFGVCGVNFILL